MRYTQHVIAARALPIFRLRVVFPSLIDCKLTHRSLENVETNLGDVLPLQGR